MILSKLLVLVFVIHWFRWFKSTCLCLRHYLLELEEWKNNENENITIWFFISELSIVAANVQGLYPNIKRTIFMKAREIA